VSHEEDLASARAVADAVMYEGYLLYPYRASAAKNRIRWQFGVLGPQGAADAGVGEEPDLSAQILVRTRAGSTVTVRLRFLQLSSRVVESFDPSTGFVNVDELWVGDQQWLAWDEAIEHELVVATAVVDGATAVDASIPISVDGATGEVTELRDPDGRLAGRASRSRRPLSAMVHLTARPLADVPGVSRLSLHVQNLATLADPGQHPDGEALGRSLLGAHLLLSCESGELISLEDPPAELKAAAESCRQHRCWPVLAGPQTSTEIMLVSPIILQDHPQLAEESAGELFDSTEIDEILTLRILTMTEDEKAEARATDPRAAQIIDRSESLSEAELSRMHGALRNPHALESPTLTAEGWVTPGVAAKAAGLVTAQEGIRTVPGPDTIADAKPAASGPETLSEGGPEVPWWDPERDASVDPGTDTVMVCGQPVGRGSVVSLHPNRRADAQDLFFTDQLARVTGVHLDVDGGTHVAVVLIDDPAADVHEWYGRYLYFAPDEIEPADPIDLMDPTEPTGTRVQQTPAVPGEMVQRKES
jgi:hypothetical protein